MWNANIMLGQVELRNIKNINSMEFITTINYPFTIYQSIYDSYQYTIYISVHKSRNYFFKLTSVFFT